MKIYVVIILTKGEVISTKQIFQGRRMKKLFFLFILYLLISTKPCFSNSTVLQYSYDVYQSGEYLGTSNIWISAQAIRTDLSTHQQNDTSVAWFSKGKSYLYNHRAKSYYEVDDKAHKQDIKRKINWQGKDNEFNRFLLNMNKESGYPDYIEFSKKGGVFKYSEEGEDVLNIKPSQVFKQKLKKSDAALIKQALIKQQTFALTQIGFIEPSLVNTMYSLLEHEVYIISEYRNDLYDVYFKLKDFKHLKDHSFLNTLPTNYNKLN